MLSYLSERKFASERNIQKQVLIHKKTIQVKKKCFVVSFFGFGMHKPVKYFDISYWSSQKWLKQRYFSSWETMLLLLWNSWKENIPFIMPLITKRQIK